MTYKIVMPVYGNKHLFENCIKKIDVDFRHLLIIDNSPESFVKEYNLEDRGATVFYYPENIGVAKAWNMGLKAGCDWTFLVSSAVAFPNGFSEVLAELNKATEYALLTDCAWHCNAISKKCVERVGYFDENFYPAYYEDTDYYRRMNLSGAEHNRPIAFIPAIGSRQSNSLDSGLPVHFQKLEDYYVKKWGGKPGEEKFDKPWNKDGLSHWVGQTLSVLKERYKTE